MILRSNRGFGEWGKMIDDPVVATELLDRLLHHTVEIHIERSSFRLREHADLMPEHVLIKPTDYDVWSRKSLVTKLKIKAVRSLQAVEVVNLTSSQCWVKQPHVVG